MTHILLIFVLAAGLAAQQQKSANPKPSADRAHSAEDASPAKSVKPNDPVITVRGICKGSSAKTEDSAVCETIVTREQFERVAAAVATAGQPVPAKALQQFAQAYVDLLAYEQAARSNAIENSREFQDLMELVRLRTLAEIQRRSLQEKYRSPSPQDITDYYHKNLSNFIDMRLCRILVPRKNPTGQNQEEYERRALQVANDLRERAAQGEDCDQLQKEGYKTLGLASPPGTDMGIRRKTKLLPESGDEIVALSVGGVSKVEQEAYGFVIYKVESKHLLTEDAAREEISQEVFRQRLENALKEITAGAHPEFNPQYFTPARPADSLERAPAGLQQPARGHQ
jgi:hypothetical protein